MGVPRPGLLQSPLSPLIRCLAAASAGGGAAACCTARAAPPASSASEALRCTAAGDGAAGPSALVSGWAWLAEAIATTAGRWRREPAQQHQSRFSACGADRSHLVVHESRQRQPSAELNPTCHKGCTGRPASGMDELHRGVW